MSEKPTLARLKAKVGEFLLLVDDGVIDASIGAVVANKLDLDAVWLMIVAGSSSGKTELLMPFFDLPYMIPISDLTVNTFASGFNMGGGQQASLLMKYKNGILVFKDFTSILSKGRDSRDAILAQMREIYEGSFDKRTGTGQEIAWRGKMGCLAAATDAVYIELANSTQMGQRFVYYNMKAPPRRESARRAQQNSHKSIQFRHELKGMYKEYLDMVIDNIHTGKVSYDPPTDIAETYLDYADFSTLARSPVHTDFKSGQIDAKPDQEGTGRMMKQMLAMSGAFMAMNQSENDIQLKHELLTPRQTLIVKRCAYDSIPSMRRHVLKLLAQYRGGINTAGMAVLLNLPTDSVKKYLYQINALELCDRKLEGGTKGHRWTMRNEEYRRVIKDIENIQVTEMEYIATNEDADEIVETPDVLEPEMVTANQEALKEFEQMPDTPAVFDDFK